MDEQEKKSEEVATPVSAGEDTTSRKVEFNMNNTATQKTVKLKPLVRQPVVTLPQSAPAGSLKPTPVSPNLVNKPAANPMRPNPLGSAAIPAAKPALKAPAPNPVLTPTAGAGASVLGSLNLKPKSEAQAEAAPAPAVAPAVSAMEDTKTTAIKAVQVEQAAPAININAGSEEGSDSSTVKLQRPQRKAPAPAPAPAVAVATTPASEVKPSAPTIKLNLNKPAAAPKAPVAPPPVVASQAAAAPEAPVAEAAPEAAAEAPKKAKLGVKKAAPDTAGAAEAPKVPPRVQQDLEKIKNAGKAGKKKAEGAQGNGLYLGFAIATLLLVTAATAITAVQYLNTYETERIGKKIELPFIQDLIQK